MPEEKKLENVSLSTVERDNSHHTITGDPIAAHNNIDRERMCYSVVMFCSAAIIGCFFLPWVPFLFGHASGYDLQQLPSSEIKLVWVIPATAVISLIAALSRRSVVAASRLTGAAPFVALLFYCIRVGGDLLKLLEVGAYLTLILAAVIFFGPPRLLKK